MPPTLTPFSLRHKAAIEVVRNTQLLNDMDEHPEKYSRFVRFDVADALDTIASKSGRVKALYLVRHPELADPVHVRETYKRMYDEYTQLKGTFKLACQAYEKAVLSCSADQVTLFNQSFELNNEIANMKKTLLKINSTGTLPIPPLSILSFKWELSILRFRLRQE